MVSEQEVNPLFVYYSRPGGEMGDCHPVAYITTVSL